MVKHLFETKSIEQVSDAEIEGGSSLKRVLGPVTLTTLGVGAIIGTGIFVLIGLAAKNYAGPSLMLSFVVAGLGCGFAAFCYAEFAAMTPVAGSAYTYAYTTLGEIMAWIIGWDLILEYAVGSATVAHGWSKYFLKLLDVLGCNFVPECLANDPLTKPGSYLNLPAFIITWLIIAILIRGVKESATFNAIMVTIKVSVILLVIGAGAFLINPQNWHPFLHHEWGWKGIMAGAAYVFFAYIGFDAVSNNAEEAINPGRDLPIGIIASLTICTILYIAVAGILTGMVPYTKLDIDAPVADAFAQHGWNGFVVIITIAAVAGITSVLIVMLMSQPRIFLAMARDGLLPKKFFGEVHPKFKTPHVATIITGIIVSLGGALIPLEDLAKLVNIGTLLAFCIVCASVIIMRHLKPDQPRPFKCPLVPLIPILGIVFNLGMMLSLELMNWVRLIVWLLIGFVIYFAYGRHRSILAQKRAKEHPEEIISHKWDYIIITGLVIAIVAIIYVAEFYLKLKF